MPQTHRVSHIPTLCLDRSGFRFSRAADQHIFDGSIRHDCIVLIHDRPLHDLRAGSCRDRSSCTCSRKGDKVTKKPGTIDIHCRCHKIRFDLPGYRITPAGIRIDTGIWCLITAHRDHLPCRTRRSQCNLRIGTKKKLFPSVSSRSGSQRW